MKKRPRSFSLGLVIVGALVGWAVPGQAMTVTALDIADGSARYHGRFDRVLDRLLDQGGVVKMGEYQPIGDIVPSIIRGRTTFSLFTSGFNGAPPPSATIDGSTIAADLSSLFLAVSRGNSIQLWNIGGQAGGTFDPETSRFKLLWNDQVPRGFSRWHSDFHSREAIFILNGTAVVGGAPTPVPIPASQVLYVTGLLGLGSWVWLKRNQVGIV